MKPFLYYVAKDLIERYGNNLSEVTIVFPGKRARLYMNAFLSYFAQGPVWAPRFLTIDELFQRFSTLIPSDNILNICRLHRIYSRLIPNAEPLDEFYGWGEILMNDFDDIDKHMVDADKLFTNAADLAALDHVDYLSEKQVEALREFFSNFDPEHQTELKRRFMQMWKVMPQMYHQLKEELRHEGMAYKGALYREVVESGDLSTLHSPHSTLHHSIYAFVGFNVLDEVEETLFAAMRDAGQALFYWDYDVFYTSRHPHNEAGLFLRHNLEKFPNALQDTSLFDNLESQKKKIRIAAATTDNAQVRYLPQWIESLHTHPGSSNGRTLATQDTAIVLCDEALMRPVLHALPDGTNVNITMGYPLTDTAIFGYFCALLDLQMEGYNADLKQFRPTALERVEKNPFYVSFPEEQKPLRHLTDNLSLIDWLIAAIESVGKQLSDTQTPTPYDQLYAEAAFQLYRVLGQFRWLVTDGILEVKPATLRRLIRQASATAKIPFHGEMNEELQVMGLLEARNLDFRHLVMLSVGEGIIPRRSADTSLIPYILRTHFGLDTTERQDAVYAYSFYRLIQRAEEITLVYNENSSGTSQREQSRFIRQLIAETQLPIVQQKITAPLSVQRTEAISVEKDAQVMKSLFAKKSLSPTAINQYIDCPLKFYFQQVAKLRMPDRPQDGIDNARFGTLFHDTCELLYSHLCHINGRKEIRQSDLSPYVQHHAPLVLPYINLAFWVDLFHGLEYDSYGHEAERDAFLRPFLQTTTTEELSRMVGELYTEGTDPYFTGLNMIIRDVILQLVRQLLRWDMAHAPFTLYGMENNAYTDITIPTAKGPFTLKVGGRIDRMDIMEINGQPTLRVVDYKTGRSKRAPASIEGIFDTMDTNAHGYYLQTLLYSVIMSRKQSLPVSPCLFYVLSATDAQGYDPQLKLGKDTINDIRDVAAEYTEGLRNVLTEIFDSTRPFVQTTVTERCKYCDFCPLCGK